MKIVNISGLIIYIVTGFQVPPELCDWWWPASGGSAPSEKTRPGILEHALCGFLSIFVEIGRPLPRNASNSRNCSHKSSFLCLPGGPGEVVAWSAARTLPSTRAGGQDDVSFTNSLKLLSAIDCGCWQTHLDVRMVLQIHTVLNTCMSSLHFCSFLAIWLSCRIESIVQLSFRSRPGIKYRHDSRLWNLVRLAIGTWYQALQDHIPEC